MSDTPRTDAAEHNMGSVVEPHYVVDADFSRDLERELVAARAKVVKLKGEAESWEKVFDRTCEHLADAKEQLRLCNVDQFTTAAELDETKKALNDKREFCYAVEQALDGLKGDYVEIIAAMRKDAGVAAERERCAKVSEEYPSDLHTRQDQWLANEIAAAIRKGE